LARKLALNKGRVKVREPDRLVLGDDAIDNLNEDWFDYGSSATALASQLYAISKTSGVCCGILGSWGSGKSSFMKLMQEQIGKTLSKASATWFTAWNPGGMGDIGDSMLYRVFSDIAKDNKELSKPFNNLKEALKLRKSVKRRVAEVLSTASKVVPGTAGAVADAASELLLELEVPRRIEDSFHYLVKWLEEKDRTVFLFIDDIDRATGEEILNLLSTLKVYVSRHRIVGIVGYDAKYVLSALQGAVPPGIEPMKFLEKIITIQRNLPVPNNTQLSRWAANLFKELLGLNDMQCRALGEYVCFRNPRQLKTLILAFSNNLPAIRDYQNLPIQNLECALVVFVAAQMGLLADADVRDAFQSGHRGQIVRTLKRIVTKLPIDEQSIDSLVVAVQTLPVFSDDMVSLLRLASPEFVPEPEPEPEEKPSSPGPERFDWSIIFSTILPKAAEKGIELKEDFVVGSAPISIPRNSKPSTDLQFQETLHELFKGGRLFRWLFPCRTLLTWGDGSLAVFITSEKARVTTDAVSQYAFFFLGRLLGHAPGFVADKACIIWIIDDMEWVDDDQVQQLIDGAKRASKGLRNPFVFEYTSSKKIPALIDYLSRLALQ
jgi:hypothetical protein